MSFVVPGALAFALSAAGPLAMPPPSPGLDGVAETYVKLVLAMGRHDADYVDAYYGPPDWKTEAGAHKRSLADIRADAARLVVSLGATPAPADALAALRREYLLRQTQALAARADILAGRGMSFDEESKALYDAVAPRHTEEDFQATLSRLETLLPGEGSLLERYGAFRGRFVIPKDRLDAVVRAALDECRRRTRLHVDLPEGESFEVEYVSGQPWSAYNWYKGGFHSLIQVNTDVPATIDRALDLACHEGYPGHHVYNALLEKSLVRDRGWKEFTVYALFSPQSLIAEGTANYGLEVAFPGREREEFERKTLFPLAGLDPAQADRFYQVKALTDQLDYVGNEAARRYLDGGIGAAAAQTWLETYALMGSERARQRLRFIERYRSYVINYNLGRDLVRAYVEGEGGVASEPARRWDVFKALLASPRLPGGLRPER